MRFVASVLIALMPIQAISKDLPYKTLVENVAALAVATKWCDEYIVDLKSALQLSLEAKANPTKAPYEAVFDETKEKLEKILGDVGATRFCSVTYETYKPGGKVPGFMVKR